MKTTGPLTIGMKVNLIAVLLIGYWTLVSIAEAIPAYARKNEATCMTCHTAWPSLNDFGRKYKENGYRFAPLQEPNKQIGKDLSWDEKFPISTILVGRPYDKKDSGNTQNRAIHEAEFMISGPMSKELSAFVEVEAEDEDTNARGFELGVPTAALTYTVNPAVNIQLSWADLLWFDSYNTYSSGHRMTRNYNAILNENFGGADNASPLRTSRQNITLFGRPVNNLFYGLAFSGNADDSEGNESETLTARIAFDLMPNVMVGGLLIDGTCTAQTGLPGCVVDRDYSRVALDTELNFDNFLINAAYLQAEDDNASATSKVENDAYFVQGLYTFESSGGGLWAPLLRYDSYERANGSEDISELTFSLNYYFSANFRGMVEFWDRSGDGGTPDDDRLTVQVYAAF